MCELVFEPLLCAYETHHMFHSSVILINLLSAFTFELHSGVCVLNSVVSSSQVIWPLHYSFIGFYYAFSHYSFSCDISLANPCPFLQKRATTAWARFGMLQQPFHSARQCSYSRDNVIYRVMVQSCIPSSHDAAGGRDIGTSWLCPPSTEVTQTLASKEDLNSKRKNLKWNGGMVMVLTIKVT